MMYETEEQQVEALKKWWKDNGKSIVAGIVIGLGGVFGWRAWVQHTDTVAAQGSNVFDQLVLSVETSNADSADKQAQLLHQEYGSTPYSAFASLMQARLLHEQGDSAAAQSALKGVIAKAPDKTIRTIAAMRLARLQIAAGELDAAAAVLQQNDPPTAFEGEYAAIRGDIARAQGDSRSAREAYQQAMAANAANADLLRLKLENLPPAS